MIAAIQLRGSIGAQQGVKDTLSFLNLGRKHSCVLLEDNPVNQGMLKKCVSFITYGPVSEETVSTIKSLLKGKTAHLHPPRGGLKSIKKAITQKGDLGLRSDMDSLIGRMLP